MRYLPALFGLGVVAGLVFYAAQDTPEPEAFLDALEKRGGAFSGHRRAHAKGICGQGIFVGSGLGASLTTAAFADAGIKSPVTFRFSTGGGNPYAPDSRRAFRSMALLLQQDDGHQWRTAMNHVPVFIIKDPADFPKLHLAHAPDPETGKPNPTKIKEFFEAHPETANMRRWMKEGPIAGSFTNTQFYGINAFVFRNGDGNTAYGRWQFVPEDGVQSLSQSELDALPKDALFDDLRVHFLGATKSWTMEVQIAGPEDNVLDPTVQWPSNRQTVSLGTLSLLSVEPQAGGTCEAINFDPLILPPGIEPSEDPILYARSAAYNISVERRLGEQVMAPLAATEGLDQ